MSDETKFDMDLDCSGLSCPLPILKTKKAITKLSSGQILKMISTDPGSNKDLPSWADRTGHEIVHTEVDGNKTIFYVKHK